MNENLTPGSEPLLGPRLRELRRHKKLSLKALADEAGTSPSALHRYESGWDRFELRTLRRLARALDVRLVVSLEPREGPAAPSRDSQARLAGCLRPLFWDVDLVPKHITEYPNWVLRRVLQFGDWDQVRRAREFFGDEAVRRAVDHRSMDERTRRFWNVVLRPERSNP